LMGRLVVK